MHALLHSVPLTLQQATDDPCLHWRLLDSYGQVWISLLWGHCSFLLSSGAHKVLFVPSKSLFPQSYVSSSSSMVGLMVTSSKRAYATPTSAAPRAPAPAAVHCWPVPPEEMLKHSSVSVSVGSLGPGSQGLFEPSEHLWQECGLILNVNLLPQLSCWGFSFALGCGVSPQSCTNVMQLLLQHLPSGGASLSLDVSPHGHSSTMQLLLQCCPAIVFLQHSKLMINKKGGGNFWKWWICLWQRWSWWFHGFTSMLLFSC